PNLSHFELNEIRSTLTILNSKLRKFDNDSSSTDNPGDQFNPQASTSFSDQRQDYSAIDNQTHSQFQFYSDPDQLPNQPPEQGQSSTTNRPSNLQESSSSVHNTSSVTEPSL
ncbi:hypothetical protein PSTG_06320, partial [Puccinia striiformis f. sp. tritici PST-78]